MGSKTYARVDYISDLNRSLLDNDLTDYHALVQIFATISKPLHAAK